MINHEKYMISYYKRMVWVYIWATEIKTVLEPTGNIVWGILEFLLVLKLHNLKVVCENDTVSCTIRNISLHSISAIKELIQLPDFFIYGCQED